MRPRPSGSEELESLRGYVSEQLTQFGWTVRRHEFETVSEIGDRLTGIQLIATLDLEFLRQVTAGCLRAMRLAVGS